MKLAMILGTILLAVSLAVFGTFADFTDSESVADGLQAGSLDLRLADFNEDFGENTDGVTETWYYANSFPGGMAPGDALDSVVYLKNIGSIKTGYLDIYCYIKDMEIGNDTDAEHAAEEAKARGRDDDGDGRIDEDPLDGIDNDGDGLIDEDLAGDIPWEPGYGIFDKHRVMIVNYIKYQNASTIDIVWDDGHNWNSNYMEDMDGDGVITLDDFMKHSILGLPPPVSGLSNFSMKVTFGDETWDLNEYQGDRTQMTILFALFN
jgi:hypothetical protein